MPPEAPITIVSMAPAMPLTNAAAKLVPWAVLPLGKAEPRC
jgi:hypothetical protein